MTNAHDSERCWMTGADDCESATRSVYTAIYTAVGTIADSNPTLESIAVFSAAMTLAVGVFAAASVQNEDNDAMVEEHLVAVTANLCQQIRKQIHDLRADARTEVRH